MESIQIKTEEELKAEVEKIYEEVIKKPEVKEALDLLDRLPDNLKYHNKAHTLDVIRETILFALADGQSREVIDLEVIAAAWHDVGYVRQYNNNEPVAVELFEKSEAYKSLSEEQRQEIINIILDTQLVMNNGKPYLIKRKSKHGYVLDADVSNFGRKDYFDRGSMVAEESSLDLSNPKIKRKFFLFALDLLQNHDWKTESARILRQEQKEENLQRLKREVADLNN